MDYFNTVRRCLDFRGYGPSAAYGAVRTDLNEEIGNRLFWELFDDLEEWSENTSNNIEVKADATEDSFRLVRYGGAKEQDLGGFKLGRDRGSILGLPKPRGIHGEVEMNYAEAGGPEAWYDLVTTVEEIGEMLPSYKLEEETRVPKLTPTWYP